MACLLDKLGLRIKEDIIYIESKKSKMGIEIENRFSLRVGPKKNATEVR